MKALLLAAGPGTRLRPLTNDIPKCLVPIRGKPLLAHWLDLLLPGGIEEVLVNTHYLSEQVRVFRTLSRWRDRIVLVHEPELLGTGGTVRANRQYFGRTPFLLAHADNLTRFSVADFQASHVNRPPGTAMTMMTFDTDTPQSCGIVELDERGVVRSFHEKISNPPGRRANGAVYILEPEIVDFIASRDNSSADFSTEVIPKYIGRIATFHNGDFHRDIGSPQSLLAAEREY